MGSINVDALRASAETISSELSKKLKKVDDKIIIQQLLNKWKLCDIGVENGVDRQYWNYMIADERMHTRDELTKYVEELKLKYSAFDEKELNYTMKKLKILFAAERKDIDTLIFSLHCRIRHISNQKSYEKYKAHKLRQLHELRKCLNKKLVNYRKYNLCHETLDTKIAVVNNDIEYCQKRTLFDFIEENSRTLEYTYEELKTLDTLSRPLYEHYRTLKKLRGNVHGALQAYKIKNQLGEYNKNNEKIAELIFVKSTIINDIKKCSDLDKSIDYAKKHQIGSNIFNALELINQCSAHYKQTIGKTL
jgi:hypothetical protein